MEVKFGWHPENTPRPALTARRAAAMRVVVIGAGLAGLAAADALVRGRA